jgi:hypothetical protein
MNMTIEKIRMTKSANDAKGDNTYLISNFNKNFQNKLWYSNELCFVSEVSEKHVTIFRPMDGKKYVLNEDNIKKFIFVGVII